MRSNETQMLVPANQRHGDFTDTYIRRRRRMKHRAKYSQKDKGVYYLVRTYINTSYINTYKHILNVRLMFTTPSEIHAKLSRLFLMLVYQARLPCNQHTSNNSSFVLSLINAGANYTFTVDRVPFIMFQPESENGECGIGMAVVVVGGNDTD